jgi:MoaA/NifB/PqqE/SkfB family radical SAM enzyme
MSDNQLADHEIDFTRTVANQYETVFIDVVGECNLRCVYCYQSDKDFKPHGGMSHEVVEAAIRFAKIYGSNFVNVTSEGEFTFGENWLAVARQLLDAGVGLMVTSNLAKPLDPEEIAILSRFATVCLSIDSADRKTLKSIRRAADIRTIAHNVVQIRAAAIAEGRNPTPVVANCVLSTGNASDIVGLVAYCFTLGVSSVAVSPLHAYGNFAFDKAQLGDDQVHDPVDTWDVAKLTALWDDFLKAVRLAKRFNVNFAVSPALAQRIINKVKGIVPDETLAPGMTRVCTQPWNRVIVQSDGTVLPCCYGAAGVGNLSTQGFEDVVNGEKMLALKNSLLTGRGLQPACRNCVGEAMGTTDQLKASLRDYFKARRQPERKAS